ncbi:ABC transporter ATP-binding protein [Xanthobacter pseudotagetidis]|uniref:ABC transporter ATP-binding protein n=1 Tax=Xanthobacter pseudotagetidis TaxID=3119911 RepID=UPI003726D90C
MSAPPLIRAENLGRVIAGEVPATLISEASLSVAPGTFMAITGPSGSGKSSLLYLLGLLDLPTTGEVYVEGQATSRLSEDARAAIRLEKLGFVFQFHFLLPEFTALENVLLPMRALGRLKGEAMAARGLALLAALGLEAHAGKRPDQLSGGQRQRVAIARALANDPAVLLADEPTGNLDTHSTEQVFAILRHLVDAERRAVVIVTHDLALAARADRQVRVVDGRIVEGGESLPAA